MEALGWCILAMILPASIILGIGLAVWEYENGGPPKCIEKLADFLVKVAEKFF